jgi:low affinity Fe/Cu permease
MDSAAFVPQHNPEHNLREVFRKFARDTARAVGASWAFFLALVVVIVWAAMGPLFKFSDTWQLVINTGTTIVTFLMVFLIQATQNRDAQAMHLKLDELLRAVTKARTGLVGLQHMTEEEIQELENEFAAIQAKYALRAQERSSKPRTVNGTSTGS